MTLGERLLPEFDHEMGNTRKTLERIVDERFDWKPHEKSFAMGELATHIANLPSWAALVISSESFDMAPEGKPIKAPAAKSRSEVLEIFERNIGAARAAIAEVSDERLLQRWSLLSNGNAIFSMPRIAVLRGFVMNHIIHHRAQLGVYLRLNDIAVPSIYGPSADEDG